MARFSLPGRIINFSGKKKLRNTGARYKTALRHRRRSGREEECETATRHRRKKQTGTRRLAALSNDYTHRCRVNVRKGDISSTRASSCAHGRSSFGRRRRDVPRARNAHRYTEGEKRRGETREKKRNGGVNSLIYTSSPTIISVST